jgi:hypothetical protein
MTLEIKDQLAGPPGIPIDIKAKGQSATFLPGPDLENEEPDAQG